MLLFFDVETTGLPRRRSASYKDVDNWPRIVSISWALYGSDEFLVEHRYAVVRPDGFTIPVDSTRVHGITTEYARTHGQLLIEVLNELEGDVEHYKPSLLGGLRSKRFAGRDATCPAPKCGLWYTYILYNAGDCGFLQATQL